MMMKRCAAVFLLSCFSALAGDYGDVFWMGKNYRDVDARLTSVDVVEISSRDGSAKIPWDKAPWSLRKSLQKWHDDLTAKKELQSDRIKAKEELAAKGIEELSGHVVSVLDDGILLRDVFSERVVKVFGIHGKVDGDFVKTQATKTDDVFQYRGALGQKVTVRVYEIAK